MSLYLVRDPETQQAVWLAWVDTANVRVYTWIPNLDRFVMNSGLAQDFYRENEMRYEVVDDAGARAAIAAEVGKIDLRSRRWMVDQFAQSPFSRTADEVLAAAVPSTRAGVRQQAAAIAGRVKDCRPRGVGHLEDLPGRAQATGLRGRQRPAQRPSAGPGGPGWRGGQPRAPGRRRQPAGAGQPHRRTEHGCYRLSAMIVNPKPVIPAGTVASLTDHVSGPVAIAAAVVVGVALALILAVWLAKKVVHKVVGIAVSAGAAAAAHEGTQTWIHHLISANLHT